MDLTQLAQLGISLPPPSAFGVDLSPKDLQVITLWLLNSMDGQRSAHSLDTVQKTVGTTVSEILPAASAPRMVVLQNNSDSLPIWLGFGKDPTATFGIRIPARGYWESPFDFTEAVRAISTGSVLISLLTSRR